MRFMARRRHMIDHSYTCYLEIILHDQPVTYRSRFLPRKPVLQSVVFPN